VLAVVHDRAASVRLEPALVQQIYALTPTEAALASALVEGKTLAEFAALRGCTEETVRTHVKRLLGKVGVRRQSELVRDLLASAALHALR
jgi:DNA-binding CsgD family transcriptional regulator